MFLCNHDVLVAVDDEGGGGDVGEEGAADISALGESNIILILIIRRLGISATKTVLIWDKIAQ